LRDPNILRSSNPIARHSTQSRSRSNPSTSRTHSTIAIANGSAFSRHRTKLIGVHYFIKKFNFKFPKIFLSTRKIFSVTDRPSSWRKLIFCPYIHENSVVMATRCACVEVNFVFPFFMLRNYKIFFQYSLSHHDHHLS
jgi:hypothetical protein